MTRSIAFAVDAAVINLVSIAVGAAVALGISVLSVPDWLETVLLAVAGVAYLLWTITYFATFWSTTGQTPGDRLMQIRVCRPDGERLSVGRSVFRLGCLTLAAIPLFAGFLTILFDDRRRGIHDMLAGTVVVASASPAQTPAPA
ncbi:MAG: RDD family protein [Thermoleophilaceae bacterium]